MGMRRYQSQIRQTSKRITLKRDTMKLKDISIAMRLGSTHNYLNLEV